VRVDGVVDARGERADRLFELGVFEGGDAAAPVADEVVVVVAAGVGWLVAGGAVADVETLDEAQLTEQLDGAIDAGNAGWLTAGAKRIGNLSSGQAAVLLGEEVDHVGASGAAEVAGLDQAVGGIFSPVLVRHVRMIVGSHRSLEVLAVLLVVTVWGVIAARA
jgi:hypothetical protein